MKFGKKVLVIAGIASVLGAGTLDMSGVESKLCVKSDTKSVCQAQGQEDPEEEFCVKSDTEDPLQPQIAEKILRFHVLANSDSTADQELKLKVRDSIGEYLAPVLEEADDLQETKELVQEQIPQIIEVAETCIKEEGYDYQVTAELARVDFPVKTYGNYTFPAGEYEALEVYIGEAQGHNWWCVLYPNMCFQGSVYEVVDEEAEAELKEVLTPEEYEDVFTEENYKVEFKFWEKFENFLDRIQDTILSSDK